MKIVNKRLFTLSVGNAVFILYTLTTTLNMLHRVSGLVSLDYNTAMTLNTSGAPSATTEGMVMYGFLWLGHLVVASICFVIFRAILLPSSKKTRLQAGEKNLQV